MNCDDVRARLSPYLDDELDPLASLEVARHLAGCADCAAELERLRAVGSALRGLDYHRASDTLRARVAAAARGSRPDAGAARRGWLSAVAAVVVIGGGAWFALALPRVNAHDALARDVVSGHVRSLLAAHLTDVTSTDQHTVKPWFAGKLDYSPPVTDYAATGFPLIGGRLDRLDGRTVSALVYEHRRHVINVFVWPADDDRESVSPPVTREGFHVVEMRHARMRYWLVSDLNADELAQFARTLAGSS